MDLSEWVIGMARLDASIDPAFARQLALALMDPGGGMAAGGGTIDLGALRRHLSDNMFSTDAGWEDRAMKKVRRLIGRAVRLQRKEDGGSRKSRVDIRAAAQRVFAGLDEDGNGMLSSIEFRHGLREHLGCKDLEMSELEGVLRLLDTNGDGSVDVEEFLDRLGFGVDAEAAGEGAGSMDSGGHLPYAVITLRNALRRFQLALWEDETEDHKQQRFDRDAMYATVSRQSGEAGPLRRLFDKYAEEVGGAQTRHNGKTTSSSSSSNNNNNNDGVARVGGARRKQGVGGRGGGSGSGRGRTSGGGNRTTTQVLTAGQLKDMLVDLNVASPMYSSADEDPATGAKLLSMDECMCMFDIADRKRTGYVGFAEFSSLFSLRSSSTHALSNTALVGSISASVRQRLGEDEARAFRAGMRVAAPMSAVPQLQANATPRPAGMRTSTGTGGSGRGRSARGAATVSSPRKIDPTMRAVLFFEMRDRLYRRHRTGEELFRALDRDRDGFVCPEDFVALLSGGSAGAGAGGGGGLSSSSAAPAALGLARRMIAPIDVTYDPVLRLPPSLAAAMLMQTHFDSRIDDNEEDFNHGFVDLSTFLELLSLSPPQGNTRAFAASQGNINNNNDDDSGKNDARIPAGAQLAPPPLLLDASASMDNVVEAIKARCDDLEHPNARYTFALLVHATSADMASAAAGMTTLGGDNRRKNKRGPAAAARAAVRRNMPAYGTGGLSKLLAHLADASAGAAVAAKLPPPLMAPTALSAGAIHSHCREGKLTATQLRVGLATVLNLFLPTERAERMLRIMNSSTSSTSSGKGGSSSVVVKVDAFVKRFQRVAGETWAARTKTSGGSVAYDRFSRPGRNASQFAVPMSVTAGAAAAAAAAAGGGAGDAMDWKERAMKAIGIALRPATLSFKEEGGGGGVGSGGGFRGRNPNNVHAISRAALRAVFNAKFSKTKGGSGGVARVKDRDKVQKERRGRLRRQRTGVSGRAEDEDEDNFGDADDLVVTSASMLRDWLEERSLSAAGGGGADALRRKNENENTRAARRNQQSDAQATRLRRLDPEGVTQLRALRLPLKLSDRKRTGGRGAAGGSWEDLFRALDMDGDGLVSERDFARAMLPYEARAVALASLSDLFYELIQGLKASTSRSALSAAAQPANMLTLFRALDRVDGASGLVCGRDLVRLVSQSSAGRGVSVGPDQVWLWWRLVVPAENQALTFEEFEEIFVAPFRQRMHVDYEAATLSRLRKAVQTFQRNKGGAGGAGEVAGLGSMSTKVSLEEAFRLFDADGNGRVDPSELQRGLERFCGIHASRQEVGLVLRALDANEDGEISVDEFVRWIRPTDKEAEARQRDNLRRQRITDLVYEFAGSPREAWFHVFRRAEKRRQKSMGMQAGGSSSAGGGVGGGSFVSLEGFTLGVLDLFERSRNMRAPSRMQCAAIFKAAGGVRNARLTRERFLRYFEDPRKDPSARAAAVDEKRADALMATVGGGGSSGLTVSGGGALTARDTMGLTADALSLRDDARVAQSGAIFATALSTILRNRAHVKTALHSAVQRRAGLSHEERRRLVQQVRSSTLSSVRGRKTSQRQSSGGVGIKRDGTRAGTVDRDRLFQGRRDSASSLVKAAAERLRVSKAPTRTELYETLQAPPLSLRLTVREWDRLLDLGLECASGRRSGQGGRAHQGEMAGVDDGGRAPLSSISVKRFLDGCAKTQLRESGAVAWGGSKRALQERRRERARVKEMEIRTRAPFAGRRY